uniref:SRCR domain-containing protein n=1 Tax=Amphimedon queenslandica TaxID=400682 RepID=A0A1X7SNX0_AMPQE
MEVILVFLLLSFLSSVKGQSQIPRTGTVMLTNGDNNRDGDVQIYHDGGWNYICYDDGTNDDFADVVCHQLGYTGGESSKSGY